MRIPTSFMLFYLMVQPAVAAPTTPHLASSTRTLQFGTTLPHAPRVSFCNKRTVRPFSLAEVGIGTVRCVGDVLTIDDEPVSSMHLESGHLAFSHQGFHVVVFEYPSETKLGYAVFSHNGRSGDELHVRKLASQASLVTLGPVAQIYDIYVENRNLGSDSKYWYQLVRDYVESPIGYQMNSYLVEQPQNFDLSRAATVTSPPAQSYIYNVSFNVNWPASGNGEYIEAHLELVDGDLWNQYIKGVAYKYNATICADGCQNNTEHLGFRGEAVQLTGELRGTATPTTAPTALTSTQHQLLHQLYAEAVVDLSRARGEQAVRLQAVPKRDVCDADSALAAVQAIISPDVISTFNNDFWGSSCGSGSTALLPSWQQETQTQLMHAMLWFQSQDTNDICTVVDECPFCHSEEKDCTLNDDGKTASPASETTIFELFNQLGQTAVKPCAECGRSPACLDNCLADEIVDAIRQSGNVSGFLQQMSYATLSVQYNGVEPAGEGKDKGGNWNNFNDWMYEAWGDSLDHDVQRDRLHEFFSAGIAQSKGYQALGKVIARVALRRALVKQVQYEKRYPTGSPSFLSNPCFQPSNGPSGLELFDSPHLEAFGENLFKWAVQKASDIGSLCFYMQRVNYMLDLMAPDRPEFIAQLGNKISILEVHSFARSLIFHDADMVSDYLLTYLLTSFSWIEQCQDEARMQDLAACVSFQQMDARIREYMINEYQNITKAFGVEYGTQSTNENTIHQLQISINDFSHAIKATGNSLANWERAAKQAWPCEDERTCDRFNAVFPAATRGLFSLARLAVYGLFVTDTVFLFKDGGWFEMDDWQRAMYVQTAISFTWKAYQDLDALGVTKMVQQASEFAVSAAKDTWTRFRGLFASEASPVEIGCLADVMSISEVGAAVVDQAMHELVSASALAAEDMERVAPILSREDMQAYEAAGEYIVEKSADLALYLGARFVDLFNGLRTGATDVLEKYNALYTSALDYIADSTVNKLANWAKDGLVDWEKYGLDWEGPQPAELFSEGMNFGFNVYAAIQAEHKLSDDSKMCHDDASFSKANDCTALRVLDVANLSFDVAAAATSAFYMGGMALGLAMGTTIPFFGIAFAVAGVVMEIVHGLLEKPPLPAKKPTPAPIAASEDILRPFVNAYLPTTSPPSPPAAPPSPAAPPHPRMPERSSPPPCPPFAPYPSPPPPPAAPPPSAPCPGADLPRCITACDPNDPDAYADCVQNCIDCH